MTGDWRDRAECRGAGDPEQFFPLPTDYLTQRETIKDFCGVCPVAAECLADDMRTPDRKYGIRGGLGEDERNELRPVDGKRYRYSVATDFLPKIRRSPTKKRGDANA